MHVVFNESVNNISNEFICSDDLERNFGDLLVSYKDKEKEIVSSTEEVSLK